MGVTQETLVFEMVAKEAMAAQVEQAAAAFGQLSDAQKQEILVAGQQNKELDELDAKQKAVYQSAIQQGQGHEAALSSAKSATQEFRVMGMSLTDLKSGFDMIGMGAQKLKAAWDFAKEGASIERIHTQWAATAESFDVDGKMIIERLDQIAHGTVDDERLIQVATRAFTNDVVTSGGQLENIFSIARAAAVRFGGDTADVFEQIAEATEQGRSKSLKKLGIVVDFEKAYKAEAKARGLTIDQLDEETKKRIRLAEVERAGAGLVAQVGIEAEDTADKFARAEVRIGDLVDELKVGAAVITADVLTAFDDFGRTLSGQETTQAKYARLLQEMSKGGVEGARAFLELEKAGMITRAELSRDNDVMRSVNDGLKELEQRNQNAGRAAVYFLDKVRPLFAAVAAHEQGIRNVSRVREEEARIVNASRGQAIEYTKAQRDEQAIRLELLKLDQEIVANGPRRTAVAANAKMSAEERATAEAQLKVSTQELAKAEAELDPTLAENALKLAQMRERVAELGTKLGEHTVVVGGATKAQLEQRDALTAQLEAFQKAREVGKATEAFQALDAALQSGKLTKEQYTERATALNAISGLYTESALKEAVAQQTLIATLTDPASEVWAIRLQNNKGALDGVAGSLDTVSSKTKHLTEEDLRGMGEASDTAHARVKTAADETGLAIDTTGAKVDTLIGKLGQIPARVSTRIDLSINNLGLLDQLLRAARAQGVNP